MKNYYEILEININASDEVIKSAYRALVKKYHPDNSNDTSKDKELFEINEAYEILSDPEKRKEYDYTLMRSRGQNYSGYSSNDDTYSDEENSVFDYEEEVVEEPLFNFDENSFAGKAFNFLKKVGKEVNTTMQKNVQIKENAYLEGLRMSDVALVRRYKSAYGFKRIGYSNALEERGLLIRKSDGTIIPTQRFKELY